VRPVGSCYMDV